MKAKFLTHKNRKPKIYFAHPSRKRSSKRKEMLIKKLKEIGYEVIDPFVGEDILAKKYGVDFYYQNPCRDFALEIKERDFNMVLDCDALFAWIPKGVTMIGTIREFDKAIENGKYTIVLCYKANPFLEDANKLYLTYRDFIEGKEFEWK